MRPLKYIIPLLLLAASTANAQSLIVLQTGTASVYIYFPAVGPPVVVTQVTVISAPDPTTPPKSATTTVLLMESGDSDQSTAILVAGIRRNPALSKLVTILDPDTEDQSGNPDKAVASAKALIGTATLPCLIGFDASGKAVVFAPIKGLPDVQAAFKKWGL